MLRHPIVTSWCVVPCIFRIIFRYMHNRSGEYLSHNPEISVCKSSTTVSAVEMKTSLYPSPGIYTKKVESLENT